MAGLLERIAARVAYVHATRVFRRFERDLSRLREAQEAALARALRQVRGGEFSRRSGLERVRTRDELRRALPLQRYEDLRGVIERVGAGEPAALFAPGVAPRMFATSSGTTSRTKLIPVTPAFIADYRRGWNTFGLKLLSDHPHAILRHILQVTGRMDESRTGAGVPCGAITGLLARLQKGIVRRYYVGRAEIAELGDARARYYALMRLGAVQDVAFAITANPATLIQLARVANEESERLIRDVRDGTLSVAADARLRAALGAGLRPNPGRAAELEQIRGAAGNLWPRSIWRIAFLACWTGGSMSHYLPRLRELWGDVPVRDIGLLASEGRVSVPLADGTAAGVLDVTAAAFEFIPIEQFDAPEPQTRLPEEVEPGREYAVVLSNTTGLLRYRLDDVVRVVGWRGAAPVVEFLYRGGRVASVVGEKLTENQVIAAMGAACAAIGVSTSDFLLAPCWAEPPYYRLTSPAASAVLAEALDRALCDVNEEYAARRRSGRLGLVAWQTAAGESFVEMDKRVVAERRCTPEQYKRQILLTAPGQDELSLPPTAGVAAPTARCK